MYLMNKLSVVICNMYAKYNSSEYKLSMSGRFQYLWFFFHRVDINAFVYFFLSSLKTNWASKIKMG